MALIMPENVREGLQHYVRDGYPSQCHGPGLQRRHHRALNARWLVGSSRLPKHEYAEVIEVCDQVVHRPRGMCPRNRDRLAPSPIQGVAARLLNFPYEVMTRFDRSQHPTTRDAQDAQMAALLCFLLRLPVRIKNASQVALARHVSRQSSEAGPV